MNQRARFPSNEAVSRSALLSEILTLRVRGSGQFVAEVHGYDGHPGLYGGEVAAQAVVAATHTVASDRHANSLHVTFLRQGDVRFPVVFDVANEHDGRSFAVRRVTGRQEGRVIMTASVSFHILEEGIQHQSIMPFTPPPEAVADSALRPSGPTGIEARAGTTAQRLETIQMRTIADSTASQSEVPRRLTWLRSVTPLAEYAALHCGIVAYLSDIVLDTALLPHGLDWTAPNIQTTSLDHSVWFHEPVEMEDWLLFVQDSPIARGARALVLGQIFSREGRLVASVAQEGLVRKKTPGVSQQG